MSNFASVQFGGTVLLPAHIDHAELRQELVEFFFSRGCQDIKLQLGNIPHGEPYGKSWTRCDRTLGRVHALDNLVGYLVAVDDKGRGLLEHATNTSKHSVINIDWFIKKTDDVEKTIRVPRDPSRGEEKQTKTKLQRQLDELD